MVFVESMMDVGQLTTLLAAMRRQVALSFSFLEELIQLLHRLLGKLLSNIGVFDLLISTLVDNLTHLVHALLTQHAHIREVTLVKIE